MCNCSPIPANICTQCSQGNTCGCPPDYSVMIQPVNCSCCPSGYSYSLTEPSYPNGICVADNPNAVTTGYYVATIPCVPCEETIPANCVILPAVSCLGVPANFTLTQFLNYMCTEAYVLNLLQKIGLSTTLKQAFCQITATCPIIGSSTPVLGPIIVTIP
jgi:hypothetical protein